MKKTILFSNIEGSISKNPTSCKFINYMDEYLKIQDLEDKNLVFINAKGLKGEENYLKSIISCFKNIDVEFNKIYEIDENTTKEVINTIDFKNTVLFLMGGNPKTQIKEIKRLNLEKIIREHEGLVFGFCAGAINLSTISIITKDEDFKELESYKGIGRVKINIEPHYNQEETLEDLYERNEDIKKIADKYKTKFYCLPDTSVIFVENDSVISRGDYVII